jgi:hypothetical protein
MILVDLSLSTAHIASRDDSNEIPAGRKDEKQQALRIGTSQHVKPDLSLCVGFIRRYDKGLIEKNLLALKRADLVLSPDFVGVLLVPIESEIPGEVAPAHDISILPTYTYVKSA